MAPNHEKPDRRPDNEPLALVPPRGVLFQLSMSNGPRTNPVVRRSSVLSVEGAAVQAVAELIAEAPSGVEAYWSPHIWRGDHRSGRRWESACGVVIECDYRDVLGTHCAPPAERAQELSRQAEKLPGNLVLWTPRGFRVVFLLDTPECDPDLYRQATAGAIVLITTAIEDLGLGGREGGGFEVDKAATDLARIFYAPRATVDGKERNGEMRIVREELYGSRALAALAPSRPEVARFLPRAGVMFSRFREAARLWNEHHPLQVSENRECPGCGHRGCYSVLSTSTGQIWTCFSANHEGETEGQCGHPGTGGWWGDALDLESWNRRQAPRQVLEEDGYLVKGQSMRSEPD